MDRPFSSGDAEALQEGARERVSISARRVGEEMAFLQGSAAGSSRLRHARGSARSRAQVTRWGRQLHAGLRLCRRATAGRLRSPRSCWRSTITIRMRSPRSAPRPPGPPPGPATTRLRDGLRGQQQQREGRNQRPMSKNNASPWCPVPPRRAMCTVGARDVSGVPGLTGLTDTGPVRTSPQNGACYKIPESTGGTMQTTAARNDRILVVDDDQRIRDLLRRYLAQEGFDVVYAEDGIVAQPRAVARQRRPDRARPDAARRGRLAICRRLRAAATTAPHHHADGQGGGRRPHRRTRSWRRRLPVQSPFTRANCWRASTPCCAGGGSEPPGARQRTRWIAISAPTASTWAPARCRTAPTCR